MIVLLQQRRGIQAWGFPVKIHGFNNSFMGYSFLVYWKRRELSWKQSDFSGLLVF